MPNNLFWDEINEYIYGKVSDFQSVSAFSQDIHNEPEMSGYNIVSIDTKLCYTTNKGLNAETITPVAECDIEMLLYYVAKVDKVQNNDYCCNFEDIRREVRY